MLRNLKLVSRVLLLLLVQELAMPSGTESESGGLQITSVESSREYIHRVSCLRGGDYCRKLPHIFFPAPIC